MPEWSNEERAIMERLRTPERIQDYLDALPINHEKKGETCFSPRRVMKEQKAHCLEGALFAAAALSFKGERPLLMNLKSARGDDDHAVALFRRHGHWGAISKTNHAVLCFRDPVYQTLRELALSYFHEYYRAEDGKKMLRAYSARPFSLRRYRSTWMTSERPLWNIAYALAGAPHVSIVPAPLVRELRHASAFERQVTAAVAWKKRDPRT